MLLARAGGGDSLTVQAYAPPPETGRIVEATAQQPFIAQVTNDEIALRPAFGRPRSKDRLTDGDRTYTLTDAAAVYEGATLIGWTLIAAGGS